MCYVKLSSVLAKLLCENKLDHLYHCIPLNKTMALGSALYFRCVNALSQWMSLMCAHPDLFDKVLGFPGGFCGSSLFALVALPLLQAVLVFRGHVHAPCFQ